MTHTALGAALVALYLACVAIGLANGLATLF